MRIHDASAAPRTLETDLVRRLREAPEGVDAEAELAGMVAEAGEALAAAAARYSADSSHQ